MDKELKSEGEKGIPGRNPCKYRPEYDDLIVNFVDIEPYKETEVVFQDKNWEKRKVKIIHDSSHILYRLAHKFGVSAKYVTSGDIDIIPLVSPLRVPRQYLKGGVSSGGREAP